MCSGTAWPTELIGGPVISSDLHCGSARPHAVQFPGFVSSNLPFPTPATTELIYHQIPNILMHLQVQCCQEVQTIVLRKFSNSLVFCIYSLVGIKLQSHRTCFVYCDMFLSVTISLICFTIFKTGQIRMVRAGSSKVCRLNLNGLGFRRLCGFHTWYFSQNLLLSPTLLYKSMLQKNMRPLATKVKTDIWQTSGRLTCPFCENVPLIQLCLCKNFPTQRKLCDVVTTLHHGFSQFCAEFIRFCQNQKTEEIVKVF